MNSPKIGMLHRVQWIFKIIYCSSSPKLFIFLNVIGNQKMETIQTQCVKKVLLFAIYLNEFEQNFEFFLHSI